ncbi:hypothetical protein NUW58_g1203 [Xylaria curta]|uniref:Uncharacterized protein n=1 Tax=Xylaria curta TaxID=42375 RepID=A0ACC1PMV6_9PEZI|nr:hypothetical protein NUW58_g1203 [Xylaria curta]
MKLLPICRASFYPTDELQGSGLGLNEQQGRQETIGDSTNRKDTTLSDSRTPQESLHSSTVKLVQNQEPSISSSVDPTMHDIRDVITEKLRESGTDQGERFLIRSALEPLLRPETVKDVLNDAKWLGKDVDIQKLADFIKDKALSVFAILIKMDKPHLIKSFFHEKDFKDSMLPIKYDGPRSDWFVESYFSKTSNAVLRKVFTQNGWKYADVVEFCDTHQWHFFPLVFTKERFRYDVPSDMRLPYAPANKVLKTTHSNYSRVERKSIYRECFESNIQTVVDDDGNYCVAVKTLTHSDKTLAEKEASALEGIRNSSSVHLIKAIAVIHIRSRGEYSFVFPWAEHGNLWDFWVRQEGAPRDHHYFINVFRQLTCLAHAISELSDNNLRHGDLKPENIVCFETDQGLPAGEGNDFNTMVRLVIIDVGLAKTHDKLTEFRAKTDTRVSTRRYAAPELETHSGEGLSRRFDVWSLGCIFLEFAIWLIYGSQRLKVFPDGDTPSEEFKFFVTKPSHEHLDSSGGPKQIADRHHTVNRIITEMQGNPLCSSGTAIRRLVDLISDKMLIVDLSDERHPDPETESQPTCKCVQGADSVSYHSTQNGPDAEQEILPERKPSTQPPLPEIRISKARTMRVDSFPTKKNSPGRPGRPYARVIKEELERILADLENRRIDAIKVDDKATKPTEASGLLNVVAHRLNDIWDYAPDDVFARDVFNSLDPSPISPRSNTPSKLCDRCRSLRLWSPTCSFSDSLAGFEDKANREGCELCRLLLGSLHGRVKQPSDQQVHFLRAGCYLTLRDDRKEVVANLCITLPSRNTSLQEVQLGFPELPVVAGEVHLEVLKGWITDCDRNHECYPKAGTFTPTRLLDIRYRGSGTIQLLINDQAHTKFGHYATLSHRWGSPQAHTKYCAYRSNIEELKRGIVISSLPRTFQDAVHIARGLGLQYLWIDSLCIIQDDPLDWERESKLMERVFSSAYCTIAASCSFGSGDGFLKPRPARRSVMMKGPQDSDAAYFVCETIDNFFQDVEQSELNQRGWVLQERALSRRTIYFTERQSYWECGEGVRCETMTRMKNRKASFLGDPNFPRSVDQFAKGLRIEIFQDLYERYSGLALSYPSDRPIAIRGLESRLINTFGTRGGVGIFDIYLHRSLLWQRAGESLKHITSFRDTPVPSWSWMAYDGPIRYLTAPFGEVAWSEDIISPFSPDGNRNGSMSGDKRGEKDAATSPLELEAPVWGLLDTESGQRIMDDPDRTFDHPIQCVVLGKSKMQPVDEPHSHWVLLVHPKPVVDDVALCPGEEQRFSRSYDP